MTTYAETQHGQSVDWWKVLADPPHVGSDEHNDLRNYAASWVSCACGQQCSMLPRDAGGCPFDSLLREQGSVFSQCISGGHWGSAKETLAKIEQRSETLLAAMGL